jgi:hypothetical protein
MSPARNRTVRIARAVEKDGARGSTVVSALGSDVGSEARSAGGDATGSVDEARLGVRSAVDEASPVHPVRRSAAAAMPTYPRMTRP